MRAIALCLILVTTSSISQDDPFLMGAALQAEIEKSCAEGCVTFSRQEAADFEQRLARILAQRMQEAFQAGVQHQRQACASLI